MALDNDLMFIGEESDFGCYNRAAILNLAIYFQNSDGSDFTFPGYISAYMNVYQARGESQLKNFTTQLNRNISRTRRGEGFVRLSTKSPERQSKQVMWFSAV